MSMKKAMKVSAVVPASDQSSGGKVSLTSSEWSHEAVSCLLETYSEKFFAGRGYLRNTDWEEVVDGVNELRGSDGLHYSKTLKQCRDKVDSLKRRYKIEKKKAAEGSSAAAPAPWPYFRRLDDIMVSVSSLKQPSSSERAPFLLPFPSPLSSSSALPLSSSSASPLPLLQAGGSYRYDGSSSGGGSGRHSLGGKAQKRNQGGGGGGGGGGKPLHLLRVSPPLNNCYRNSFNNNDEDDYDEEEAAERSRRNGAGFGEEDINGVEEEEEEDGEDDNNDDDDDRGNDRNDGEEGEEWNEVESFRCNPRYYGKPTTTTMTSSSSSSSSDDEAVFHASVRNRYPNHNPYPNPNPNPNPYPYPNPNPKAKPNPNSNPRYGRTRTLGSIDPHGREMGVESGRLSQKRKPSNPASPPNHGHCPVTSLSNDVPRFAHVFARIEFAKKEIFAKMELEMAKLRKRRRKRLVDVAAVAAVISTSTSGSG